MPLDLQFYTLFVMVLTGIAAGIIFDVFRAVRGVTGARGLVGDLWDLLFWAIVTLLVAVGLVIGNWGKLRVGVLLAAVLGVWIYTELASDLVLAAARRFLLLVGRAALSVLDLIATIVLWPLELALTLVQWVAGFVLAVARALFALVAWLFEPLWVGIYLRFETPIGYYRHRLGPYLYLLRQLLR